MNGGPVVIPQLTTTYTVESVSALGCISAASAIAVVVVVPVPTVVITQNSPVLCAGEMLELSVSGADAYVWFNGSVSQSISVAAASGPFAYGVTCTDNLSGCQTFASLQLTVSDRTGLNKIEETRMLVFPNPARDGITVESPYEALLELRDLSGRLVHQGKISSGTFYLNLAEFSSGVYSLSLKTENFFRVYSVIKQD